LNVEAGEVIRFPGKAEFEEEPALLTLTPDSLGDGRHLNISNLLVKPLIAFFTTQAGIVRLSGAMCDPTVPAAYCPDAVCSNLN
jgi:hypothetical protein